MFSPTQCLARDIGTECDGEYLCGLQAPGTISASMVVSLD